MLSDRSEQLKKAITSTAAGRGERGGKKFKSGSRVLSSEPDMKKKSKHCLAHSKVGSKVNQTPKMASFLKSSISRSNSLTPNDRKANISVHTKKQNLNSLVSKTNAKSNIPLPKTTSEGKNFRIIDLSKLKQVFNSSVKSNTRIASSSQNAEKRNKSKSVQKVSPKVSSHKMRNKKDNKIHNSSIKLASKEENDFLDETLSKIKKNIGKIQKTKVLIKDQQSETIEVSEKYNSFYNIFYNDFTHSNFKNQSISEIFMNSIEKIASIDNKFKSLCYTLKNLSEKNRLKSDLIGIRSENEFLKKEVENLKMFNKAYAEKVINLEKKMFKDAEIHERMKVKYNRLKDIVDQDAESLYDETKQLKAIIQNQDLEIREMQAKEDHYLKLLYEVHSKEKYFEDTLFSPKTEEIKGNITSSSIHSTINVDDSNLTVYFPNKVRLPESTKTQSSIPKLNFSNIPNYETLKSPPNLEKFTQIKNKKLSGNSNSEAVKLEPLHKLNKKIYRQLCGSSQQEGSSKSSKKGH